MVGSLDDDQSDQKDFLENIRTVETVVVGNFDRDFYTDFLLDVENLSQEIFEAV